MAPLLYPEEIDQRLNWPLGRAERLARQRRLPYVLLPDGSLRMRWEAIKSLVVEVPAAATPAVGGNETQSPQPSDSHQCVAAQIDNQKLQKGD